MSQTTTWTRFARMAFAHSATSSHRVKPKRPDTQHRLRYLDDSRMRREVGHL